MSLLLNKTSIQLVLSLLKINYCQIDQVIKLSGGNQDNARLWMFTLCLNMYQSPLLCMNILQLHILLNPINGYVIYIYLYIKDWTYAMYEITVAGQEYSKKTSSNHWVAWYLVYIYIYIYILKSMYGLIIILFYAKNTYLCIMCINSNCSCHVCPHIY